MVKEVKNKLYSASTKMKEFLSSNRFVLAGQKALIGAGFFALTPLYAFADLPTIEAGNMMTNLIAIVCDIFRMIGAVLLVWAIGQLVMAFKNEDADSKSRAMMVLVCAILLISVKTVYQALTGTEVTGTGITGL